MHGRPRRRVTNVLDDLGNEINLSFDFFENQFDGEVQEVHLSGGTVLLPFLEEKASRRSSRRRPGFGIRSKA